MFKREIHNGDAKVSFKVKRRWFGERKYDMIWVYRKDGCGQGRKEKKSSNGRLAVDSRKSLSGRLVQSPVLS